MTRQPFYLTVPSMFVWIVTLASAGVLPLESVAGSPNKPSAKSVHVDPEKVDLIGPIAKHSILVNGRDHAGVEFDLTRDATFRSLQPDVVTVTDQGVVQPVSDGKGVVEVQAAGRTLRVQIRVDGSHDPRTFHFENDIIPVLTRFGCNMSGCHGKAEGQNGFKLSVFGFDPEGDYDALVKEARGRRVSATSPEASLLLQKAINRMPHGGGARFDEDSWAYSTLHDWMLSGLAVGAPDAPKVESISVTPQERRLRMNASQQLRVVARYTDGRQIDVTDRAKYQSNNEGIASVDEFGLVSVGSVPGQVAIMASYMGAVNIFQALIPRAGTIEEYPEVTENNFVDGLVYAKLKKLNLTPSEAATDGDFLRRVYLDVIGTLPTAEEARAFLADERPSRRQRVVEELFQRPEYSAYWALKWADLLRVDRDALGHRNAYAYYSWIRKFLAENRPLDRFVYDVLTAEGPLDEAPQGGLFQVVKKPGERASTISQVFLGIRIDCAECHHHPFDRWSQRDYYGMADFFTQLQTKKTSRGEFLLAAGNPETKNPRTGEVVFAHPLGTRMPESAVEGDRRVVLAEWMTASENPWFARNLANRIWAHFMGRGLVDPVDDVRATNPPSNPELLDALATHLIEQKFDIQALIRTITSSAVYQRSSRPNETNARDEQNYSRALLKQMDAEVLLDAVSQVTGVAEHFDGVSSGQRAIELWDSQVLHYFLGLFGRPIRKSACECERMSEPSVAQVLHLMNSPKIHNKLTHDDGTIARMNRAYPSDERLIDELYLTFFSRYPTTDEKRVAVSHLENSGGDGIDSRRDALVDVAWSLLNSLEFTLNH